MSPEQVSERFSPAPFIFSSLLPSGFSSSVAVGPGSPPTVLGVSLTLADRGPALGPRGGLLASLVEQRVAGGVEIFDLHLVVVHAHGR